jgi:hypothetical protein
VSNERYYIDERNGCIAICDSTIPTDALGLHADSPHVIEFCTGHPIVEACAECGHRRTVGWNVPDDVRAVYLAACKQMNESALDTPANNKEATL